MLTKKDVDFLRSALPAGFKISADIKPRVDHFVMRGYLAIKVELNGNKAILTPKGESTLQMIAQHPGWANKPSL